MFVPFLATPRQRMEATRLYSIKCVKKKVFVRIFSPLENIALSGGIRNIESPAVKPSRNKWNHYSNQTNRGKLTGNFQTIGKKKWLRKLDWTETRTRDLGITVPDCSSIRAIQPLDGGPPKQSTNLCRGYQLEAITLADAYMYL
jgi:hypothetical protein